MDRPLARVAAATLILAGFIVLLVPVLLNRGPIYWFDTLAYLHGGGSAIESVFGVETRYHEIQRAASVDVSQLFQQSPENATQSAATTPDTSQSQANADYQISQARSVYYSMVLVSISSIGGSAAPVFAVAALLTFIGVALLRTVFQGRLILPGLWILAATCVSSISVFVALLLPDVLAPLAILSVAMFFAFYNRLSAAAKWGWAALLLVSTVSHSTHFVVAVFLIPIGALLAVLLGRSPAMKPMLWCSGALAITVVAGMGFTQAVQTLYGYKPLPLPMIAASLITDAPGRAFLEKTCPENGYIYCEQLGTQAVETDQFLWSKDPKLGVYQFADTETRRAMSEQQFSFLWDTLRDNWQEQIAISLGRFWKQLFENDLDQTTYNDAQRRSIETLPEPDRSVAVGTGLYRQTLSFEGFGKVAYFVALASAVSAFAILTLLWSSRRQNSTNTEDASLQALTIFALLLLAGVLANSGLTGAFSQPQGRYAARVTVLIPVLAGLLAAWMVRNHGVRSNKGT